MLAAAAVGCIKQHLMQVCSPAVSMPGLPDERTTAKRVVWLW